MTIRDNEVVFMLGKGITSLDFIFDDKNPGNSFSITSSQKFRDVSVTKSSKKLVINIFCGRNKSQEPATWFSESVDNNTGKILGIDTNTASPNELNFAIKGQLLVNGDTYNITLGQGTQGTTNNWWITSNSMNNANHQEFRERAEFGSAYWVQDHNYDMNSVSDGRGISSINGFEILTR